MNDVEIETHVWTYPTGPIVPAKIILNGGFVLIQLGQQTGHDFNNNRTPDVYLERRSGEWVINISPDNEVRVAVHVTDEGNITALNSRGETLLDEAPLDDKS